MHEVRRTWFDSECLSLTLAATRRLRCSEPSSFFTRQAALMETLVPRVRPVWVGPTGVGTVRHVCLILYPHKQTMVTVDEE